MDKSNIYQKCFDEVRRITRKRHFRSETRLSSWLNKACSRVVKKKFGNMLSVNETANIQNEMVEACWQILSCPTCFAA